MEKPKEKNKLSIPDDDLPNWMRVLREDGMTDDEINGIFCKTNKTWLEARLPELIERALEKINDTKKRQNGIGLIGKEREYFRKAIEKGLREGTRNVND
jgi:hypothetical protein